LSNLLSLCGLRHCEGFELQDPKSNRIAGFRQGNDFSHSLGHEEWFPPPRLSAGYPFRKQTIAGTRRNGQDAP
jgi:hypothetical protein